MLICQDTQLYTMTHLLMQEELYLSKQIQYEVLMEIHMDISGWENIWVKLIDFNVILANIYRHPKNNL